MSDTTRKELRNALIRLKHGRPKVVDKKRKISISALAEEAGIADSTIHNRYPDIAAEVRNLVSTDHRLQRDEKNDMLKVEKEKNKQLRSQIEQLELDVRKLASINASQAHEISTLKAHKISKKIVSINQN